MVSMLMGLTALLSPAVGGAADLPELPDATVEVIATAWQESKADAVWRSPTVTERETLQEAASLLVAAADDCPVALLQEVAVTLEAIDVRLTVLGAEGEGPRVVLLQEGQEHRGLGLFALRCGAARPWVFQAPHSFHDRHTGRLVRNLFGSSGARAAAWNTVHRYRSRPDEDPREQIHPADVTREYGSTFHAVTVAMATAAPALRFIQVHGFAGEGRDWDAIISTGDPEDPPAGVADSLAAAFGRVAAYGRDVHVLGATTNVQGKVLSRWSDRRFLHLELSLELRSRLSESREARRPLIDALVAGGW